MENKDIRTKTKLPVKIPNTRCVALLAIKFLRMRGENCPAKVVKTTNTKLNVNIVIVKVAEVRTLKSERVSS